jgi:hypothetical protein
MAYAADEELRRWMGNPDWDEEDTARAQDMLDGASGVIDAEIGLGPDGLIQRLDSVVLDGSGTRKLLLPRWPVSGVTSVTVTDASGVETALVEGEGEDYTWSQTGILTRLSAVWPCGDRNVAVVYTAGQQPVSADVARICKRLAAAGWHNPAGADTEDIADHRVKWNTPGMELTTAERRILSRYKDR